MLCFSREVNTKGDEMKSRCIEIRNRLNANIRQLNLNTKVAGWYSSVSPTEARPTSETALREPRSLPTLPLKEEIMSLT